MLSWFCMYQFSMQSLITDLIRLSCRLSMLPPCVLFVSWPFAVMYLCWSSQHDSHSVMHVLAVIYFGYIPDGNYAYQKPTLTNHGESNILSISTTWYVSICWQTTLPISNTCNKLNSDQCTSMHTISARQVSVNYKDL